MGTSTRTASREQSEERMTRMCVESERAGVDIREEYEKQQTEHNLKFCFVQKGLFCAVCIRRICPYGNGKCSIPDSDFFFLIFMYVFVSLFLAVLGLHCFTRAFPSYSKQGLPFITTTALQRMGFSLQGFLSQWSSGSRLQ